MSSYTLRPKRFYRPQFLGTTRLFDSCWSEYRLALRQGIGEPTCDMDVMVFLDEEAARRVNNSRSSFYIYGE